MWHGHGVNGKSMAPNDIIAKFITWMGKVCRIRGGGQKKHSIVHILIAWEAVDHNC